MPRQLPHSTWVPLVFFMASILWINIANQVQQVTVPGEFPTISTWKGWAYLLLASLLLKVVLFAEERRRAEVEVRLYNETIYDPLTHLLNRRAFDSHFEAAVERARRNGARLGLAFIDLDDFKNANDTFGHGFGDELLRAVATRLRSTLRSADIAGRLGGDGFVVVVEPSDGDGAETLARRLLDTFSEPLRIGDRAYPLTLSVGVAHFPDNGGRPEQLIRAADMAMYAAKATGRHRFALAAIDPEPDTPNSFR